MSAEFYKYATDKIKKEKQENQVAKENMKAKTKQRQDPQKELNYFSNK